MLEPISPAEILEKEYINCVSGYFTYDGVKLFLADRNVDLDSLLNGADFDYEACDALADCFGTSRVFWMNLQATYSLQKLQYEHKLVWKALKKAVDVLNLNTRDIFIHDFKVSQFIDEAKNELSY